jgi:glycosyltransferase involved in cell wall biosynthesis
MKEIFSVTDVLIAPVSVKKAIIAPPLTWLEAMSYGIPVVTTNVGGANEVIINGINGFISLEENLESTIMKCLNKDNIIKLSENARQMIKQRFDIENIASNYFDLWNGLVNE